MNGAKWPSFSTTEPTACLPRQMWRNGAVFSFSLFILFFFGIFPAVSIGWSTVSVEDSAAVRFFRFFLAFENGSDGANPFSVVLTRPPPTTPASQGVARSLSIGRPFKLRSDGFPAHSDRIDRRNEQQQQQQQQQQQPSQRPQFKEFRRIVSFFLAKRWFFLVGSLTAQSMRLDEMIRIGRFSVGLCRPSIAPMEFDFAT